MPNTSPSPQGSSPASAHLAEAAQWAIQISELQAAAARIAATDKGSSDVTKGEIAASIAASAAATAKQLGLAQAAKARAEAAAAAWSGHTHPYVDNT